MALRGSARVRVRNRVGDRDLDTFSVATNAMLIRRLARSRISDLLSDGPYVLSGPILDQHNIPLDQENLLAKARSDNVRFDLRREPIARTRQTFSP